MSGLRSAAEAAREAARIAATPAQTERQAGSQAEELLAVLRGVVPYQAAWLALLDDGRRCYTELASVGYGAGIRGYFGMPVLRDQIELVGLSRSGVPQCARDSPVPLGELPVWAEYYLPAGFREGLAVGLFTADRRHLGVLVMNTDETDHPTDAERDLIGALAPRIASAVDPLRSLAVLARVVRDAVAAVAVTRAGEALLIPGLPGHTLLAPGSALLSVATRQHAHGPGCRSFLWPARPGIGDREDRGDLVQVTVLSCPAQPPHLVALVVLSVPADRAALTRRELVILGLLLEGWSDQRVAMALGLPPVAVADISELITIRLAAPDRETALLRAARQGWFIPHRHGTPPPD